MEEKNQENVEILQNNDENSQKSNEKCGKMQKKAKKPSVWRYLSHHKLSIFFYTLLTFVSCGIDILCIFTMSQLLVEITEGEYIQAIYYALGLFGMYVAVELIWWVINWLYLKVQQKITADMNYDLAKQAFKLNSKTYNDHSTGTFVQRIVGDPADLVQNLANIFDVFMYIIEDFVIFFYIATLNVWVALAMIAFNLIGMLVNWKRLKVRRQNRLEVRKANDKVHSLTTEIVKSEKDIKSLGLEEKLSQTSKENYNILNKTRYKFSILGTSYNTLLNIVLDVGKVFVIILALWLTDRGLMTLASFMIVYSYRGQAFNLTYQIGQFANIFVDISVSHQRIFSLFDEEEYVTEKFGTESLDISGGGEVEFKNVSFTYKEYDYPEIVHGDDSKALKKKKKQKAAKKLVSENKVFENLSFKVQQNTTVAFVGKSGSGKSTLLNLMSKMYEADGGEVLIDGVDIKKLNKETLRGKISLVNQFPYIFDMTIRENLALACPDASDEELNDALKKASLDEFVDSLPNGIDTKVGESGIKLSGGQRQRLAIARALLRKSSIIIFDESTSSLDNFAQNNVKKSIDGLKGTSTIIIVAHRLSTIKNVDHIFFLDDGKIVDEGTFDELFERNQTFHAMFLAENI